MVLYSAIQIGYYFMSIIAILVSVISASYYLKIIKVLFTETEYSKSSLNTNNNLNSFTVPLYPLSKNIPFVDVHDNYYVSYYITNLHSFLISTLTLLILFFILKPSLLLNSTQLLSLSLFYC